MKYQFYIDLRPAGPLRDDWIAAAQDAVNAGYAVWISEDQIKLDRTQGASIERIDNL